MSYYSVLELEREPFSTSPDPNFFYQSAEHLTALRKLEIAIRLKRGLSLILGDVGTGKTTLSRALLQAFEGEENDFIFHMILDPDFRSEYQFLTCLTKMFGASPFFRSTMDHRDAIEKYLFQQCVERGKTVVLMIDEGQKLTQPFLEILRTLLNYETNEQKLLQLVILSQMELLPRIQKVRNFMDRIALKFIINPLGEKEAGEMIEFRLEQAGYSGPRPLFLPNAVQRIYEYTQGYPRRIAMICHAAMEELAVGIADQVTGEMMADVIARHREWH